MVLQKKNNNNKIKITFCNLRSGWDIRTVWKMKYLWWREKIWKAFPEVEWKIEKKW